MGLAQEVDVLCDVLLEAHFPVVAALADRLVVLGLCAEREPDEGPLLLHRHEIADEEAVDILHISLLEEAVVPFDGNDAIAGPPHSEHVVAD